MGFTLANDTTATVTLDAGKSYDPEGLPLQYRWYDDDELVCEQARFTTVLFRRCAYVQAGGQRSDGTDRLG